MSESFCELLYLCFWPPISVILGILLGGGFAPIFTFLIFFVTIIRLPLNLYKTLEVAITTKTIFATDLYPTHPENYQENNNAQNVNDRKSYTLQKIHNNFTGPFLNLIVRILSIILIPLPHFLFIIVITVIAATAGTLYYIGQATKVVYKHEYLKTAKKVGENVKMEPKSYLGKYWKAQCKFFKEDKGSEKILYGLKTIWSFVFGFVFGLPACIPFSLGILLITLVRLPMNFFITMKIAFTTVLLKWDLKLLVLLNLPIVHILFPVIAFTVAVIGYLFIDIGKNTVNIYKGKSPFENLKNITKFWKKYWLFHQEFIGEKCVQYLHPTGIPYGWRGDIYGVPFKKILKFQWKCILFIIMSIYAILISSTLSLMTVILKWIPMWFFAVLIEYTKEYFDADIVWKLMVWPFWLAGYPFFTALLPVVLICCAVGGTFYALRCPIAAVLSKKGFKEALGIPFDAVSEVDDWTKWKFAGNFRLYSCFDDMFSTSIRTNNLERQPSLDRNQPGQSKKSDHEIVQMYWDIFIQRCIKETATLIKNDWLDQENVECVDAACVQAIPAYTIYSILQDSILDSSCDKDQGILWSKENAVKCDSKTRPKRDNIANLLWPKIASLKKFLLDHKSDLMENSDKISALLCSIDEEDSEPIRKLVENIDQDQNYAKINRVRTQVNDLVICISRMHDWKQKSMAVFTHDYDQKSELERSHDHVSLPISES